LTKGWVWVETFSIPDASKICTLQIVHAQEDVTQLGQPSLLYIKQRMHFQVSRPAQQQLSCMRSHWPCFLSLLYSHCAN